MKELEDPCYWTLKGYWTHRVLKRYSWHTWLKDLSEDKFQDFHEEATWLQVARVTFNLNWNSDETLKFSRVDEKTERIFWALTSRGSWRSYLTSSSPNIISLEMLTGIVMKDNFSEIDERTERFFWSQTWRHLCRSYFLPSCLSLPWT